MRRRLLRLCFGLSAISLASWIGLSPRFSPSLYDDKLFKPQLGLGNIKELKEFNRFENHELYFPGENGSRLHGWIFKNRQSDKVIVFYPGNAGDIAKRLPLIEYLLTSGASVFIYEPRGFGLSPGKPSVDGILADGRTAYDFIRSLGYNPGQIVLYGESLGAAVAAHVSSTRPAAGIILQCGFASLTRIAREQVPALRFYPSFLFPAGGLDNAAIMSGPHAPLLILHGEKDTLIHIGHSEEIFQRASHPKSFVRFPGSGHSDVTPADLELFINTVSAFLEAL